MWHEKQENIILSGQGTCPPKGFQGAHMDNKIIPPPSGNIDINFLGGSSRKRKLTAMDRPKSAFEYSNHRESNLQEASSLSVINIEGNSHGLCLNQPKSVKPTTFRHEFEKDKFHHQNDFTGTQLTSSENVLRSGIEKINSASVNMPTQLLHCNGPLIDMQIRETCTGSNQKSQAYNMISETVTQKSLPVLNSQSLHTEKVQIDPRLQDLLSFAMKNNIVTDEVPLEILKTLSERLSPVEIFPHNFLQFNGFSDYLNGSTWAREEKKLGISCEFRQRGQCSSNAGINDVPTVGTASMGTLLCSEQNEGHKPLQTEVQLGSAPLGESYESKEQGYGDDNIKIKEKIEASETENLKHTLTEEFSPKKVESPANIVGGHGQKNDPSQSSFKLNEKSKLHSGKAASTVAEKLWDGSLQLNSSVTVSTVAFFKSGEKLLDINWSDFVEVKGKVRLEAFEKYIQDLPRSRNRGLMVISLCWREGSSETGLTGMKEVAKGYQKGERVGFAQLSPGIDLYICPRSDTIITILAKYGFFKGMAAVEDNQDSLIGCVVWRKNRTFSNLVARKSECKNTSLSEQPLNSPSNSSTQQVTKIKPSPPQLSQEFLSLTSVTTSSTHESAGKNGLESNYDGPRPREVQSSEVSISFSGANSLSTPSTLSNSSSILVENQRSTYSNSASLNVSCGQFLEVEAPTHCSKIEQPKISLEFENRVMPPPSDVLKQPDYDDLPEFDFGTACGISQTKMSKPLDAVMSDKRVPTEGTRKMDESVLPPMPIERGTSVSNRRSDHSALPRFPLASSQGMHMSKRICERESQIPVLSILEEKHGVQSKATPIPASTSAFAPPKNLFDDDDDMPEWCPPEPHKQSLAETAHPSASIPSKLPNSTFQNIHPGPPRPWPVLPSPSPAATCPPFSSQEFPAALHCQVTITAKSPQPTTFPRGPSPSVGFNSNLVLRPHQMSSDVKPPFHPADNRGWRPR